MSKSAEAFRTISEVAGDLEVPKHVLRFWEAKFPQIRPMKRGGGRRYYRPEDLELLRGIQHLLHAEGYTIKGVQKILREQGIDHVKAYAAAGVAKVKRAEAAPKKGRVKAQMPGAEAAAPKAAPEKTAVGAGTLRQIVEAAIIELEACRRLLTGDKKAPSRAEVQTAPRARAARG